MKETIDALELLTMQHDEVEERDVRQPLRGIGSHPSAIGRIEVAHWRIGLRQLYFRLPAAFMSKQLRGVCLRHSHVHDHGTLRHLGNDGAHTVLGVSNVTVRAGGERCSGG